MHKKERKIEDIVKSAYQHTVSELGLENVKPSLRLEFKTLEKAHDAIHEFIYLQALLMPPQAREQGKWYGKSAFIIYQWEVFHHAHRSLAEALCAYYNAAFVLLRTVLELLIKGTFWECLSHKDFRNNSQILDKNGQGKLIKKWLNDIFKLAPDVEEEFEKTSAGICDKIGPLIKDLDFRPQVRMIISQLEHWGIFNPIPDAEKLIYKGIYARLSADVHVIPDKTDIGRRILKESDKLFDQEILQDTLHEYVLSLHEVMDLAVVVELNIMKDLIGQFDEAQANLRGQIETVDKLGLKYSSIRARELLNLAV